MVEKKVIAFANAIWKIQEKSDLDRLGMCTLFTMFKTAKQYTAVFQENYDEECDATRNDKTPKVEKKGQPTKWKTCKTGIGSPVVTRSFLGL